MSVPFVHGADAPWSPSTHDWHAVHVLGGIDAGILYRGVAGYTRAQTVMVLMNSLGVESVMLLMFFSAPAATTCALKVVPG